MSVSVKIGLFWDSRVVGYFRGEGASVRTLFVFFSDFLFLIRIRQCTFHLKNIFSNTEMFSEKKIGNTSFALLRTP